LVVRNLSRFADQKVKGALRRKTAELPNRPGVYLMKDDTGEVIYIGKALSLRKRVSSYFQKGRRRDPKTAALISKIADFDIIMTDSEIEALMLECNLIKKHRPYYNVLLMDDKHYPYLKMTVNETYPRLFIARRIECDGARYFGPYTDAGGVREALKLVKRLFGLRSCRKEIDGQAKRHCLNHQIKLCSGPCSGHVSREEYVDLCHRTALFLSGHGRELIKELSMRMKAEAEALNFEQAARFRDQIKAVQAVMERQKIIDTSLEDRDVIALARAEQRIAVQIFNIRAGKMTGQRFFTADDAGASDGEVMSAFIAQYYAVNEPIKTLLLSHAPDDEALLVRWLEERLGRKAKIYLPLRGSKHELVKMAAINAEYKLWAELSGIADRNAATRSADNIEALRELFHLAGYGDIGEKCRIEAYDISNLAGSDAVGAMVVMENGRLVRSEYRNFRIKGDFNYEQDDYGMMAEMLQRRFKRLFKDGDMPPQAILIDGGRGQLNVALSLLRKAGLEKKIKVLSLAEGKEEVYLPEQLLPLRLPRDSRPLQLLQQLRDEVHRTAIEHHRRLRAKRLRRSVLDEIKGLGPARKQMMISSCGSVAEIALMPPAELAARSGIPLALAERVRAYLSDRLGTEGSE
jgi:excinuclease ABC subunit C